MLLVGCSRYVVTRLSVEDAGCANQDLSSFDTRSVVDMNNMFRSALSLQGKGLSSFNLTNVMYMSGLFETAISL
jgi:hypothetical protein